MEPSLADRPHVQSLGRVSPSQALVAPLEGQFQRQAAGGESPPHALFQTSYEMMMQCVSRMLAHPLHVISMRCMVQFVGREAKYRWVTLGTGRVALLPFQSLPGQAVLGLVAAPFLL